MADNEALERWQAELKAWSQDPRYQMLMSWYTLSGTELMDEVNRTIKLYVAEFDFDDPIVLPIRAHGKDTVPRLLRIASQMGFDVAGYWVEGFYSNQADQQSSVLVSMPHYSEMRLLGYALGAVNAYIWSCSAYKEEEALLRLMGQAVEELVWRKRSGRI